MDEEKKSEKAGNSELITETEKLATGDKIELLSGLLDYYASRATSFASLFIAAFFGVVALSAIIKSIRLDNFGFWCYVISFFPYIFFIGLTWITWQRFQYWKDVADRIEIDGLRDFEPSKTFLKTVIVKKTNENLYDFLHSQYLEADKKCLRRHTVNRLGTVFSVTIILLTCVVYWDFFFELFRLVGFH